MSEYEWAVFNERYPLEPAVDGLTEAEARRTVDVWTRDFGVQVGSFYVARRPNPVMPPWERVALDAEVQDCTCVVSCADDPATACSLSGQPHVHPDSGTGLFGPCPMHPDAPGDI